MEPSSEIVRWKGGKREGRRGMERETNYYSLLDTRAPHSPNAIKSTLGAWEVLHVAVAVASGGQTGAF
eukprot:scaffold191516_cov37-Tisochrysis_lutea.AAC.1